MTALLSGFLPYIIAGVAAVLGVLGYGYQQRRAGAKGERAKQIEAEAKARTIADEIDDAVAGRTAEENRKRLGTWAKR